jgi:N-acetylneuraminic acid mutarotase
MSDISTQLIALNDVKTDLKANLVTQGITLAGTETFAVLADKVLEIEGGAEFNIHCQVEEPTATDGLWVKKDFTPSETIIAMSRFFNNPQVDDTHSTKAIMPNSRRHLTAQSSGGLVFCLLGWTTAVSDLNVAYEPLTNTWVSKTNSSSAQHEISSALVGGKIFCFGGRQSSGGNTTNQAYDIATDTWATRTALTSSRYRGTAQAYNDLFYYIGGIVSATVGTNQSFNTLTNTWVTLATCPVARHFLSSVIINGLIYIFGGRLTLTGAPYTSTVYAEHYCYDISTNTWSEKASMPSPRHSLSGATVNGIIYAIGGDSTSGDTTGVSNSVFSYDPLTDTWETKNPLSSQRAKHTNGVVDGVVYIIGGEGTGNMNTSYTPIGTKRIKDTLLVDTASGINQVELIKSDAVQLTLPVKGVGVGDNDGYLKNTPCAWHNGTEWIDIL